MHKDLEMISNKGTNIHTQNSFSVFHGHANIFLGSNIYLVDAVINAGETEGRVTIDDYVFFGHGVKILARGHDYRYTNIQRQNTIMERPIHLKQGAWIASGAIILGGVTVGKNAVVGANSVVTKNVPDNAVVAGNPAKLIKYIDRELTFFEKIKKYFK